MNRIATAALVIGMLDATAASAEPQIQVSHPDARSVSQVPAAHFTGNAKVEMLFTPNGPDRTSAGSVTFSAGAHTAWHTHPLGQTLIVTAGAGRVQRWGGPVEVIKPGDVVRIPPNTKHWHGAGPDGAMTHIAIQEALDGKSVDWLEKLSDAQYQEAVATHTQAPSVGPTAAQKLLGDVAPKFAQLTDDVLFGDVWSRPGLSRRDRSLVTVSALIAMNRPDQLRSHLALARQNGLTQDELVEAITHLAFYAGWPSSVTAVGVAREVFAKP